MADRQCPWLVVDLLNGAVWYLEHGAGRGMLDLLYVMKNLLSAPRRSQSMEVFSAPCM